MFLKNLFGSKVPTIPDNCAQSTIFTPVTSRQKGSFTLLVGDKALELIQKHAGVSFEDIAALPEQMFMKCRESGFSIQESVHFLLDVTEVKHPKNSTMFISRMEPTMDLNGVPVTRSILINKPVYEAEMEAMEHNFTMMFKTGRAMLKGDNSPEAIHSAIIPSKRIKTITSISHELVHVFATDDWSWKFGDWDLDTIELLTDSINMDTVYRQLIKGNQSASYFLKVAYGEGIPYLSNLFPLEQRITMGPDALLERMYEKSREIFSQCQQRYLKRVVATPTTGHQAGRNAPCPCGSGKKYKKCCMNG